MGNHTWHHIFVQNRVETPTTTKCVLMQVWYGMTITNDEAVSVTNWVDLTLAGVIVFDKGMDKAMIEGIYWAKCNTGAL